MFGDAFADYQTEGMILAPYRKLIERLGWWGKPLGLCPKCFNVWLVVGCVVCIELGLNVIPYTVCAIGISNFTLKKVWT